MMKMRPAAECSCQCSLPVGMAFKLRRVPSSILAHKKRSRSASSLQVVHHIAQRRGGEDRLVGSGRCHASTCQWHDGCRSALSAIISSKAGVGADDKITQDAAQGAICDTAIVPTLRGRAGPR